MKRRHAPAALLFALAAGLSMARVVAEIDVAGDPARGGAALTDFRDAFYFPGVALLEGHNPYASIDYLNRYPVGSAYPLYSPASLLLHLPFSLLPYRLAQVADVVLNLALLPLLVGLALRLCGRRPDAALTLALSGALLLSRPGHQNLFLGQCTVYVVLGVYLALLYARTRPWLASGGLALAMIKPTFGVPLAVLMLCRGERRVVAFGLAVTALSVVAVLFPLVMTAGGVDGLLASVEENYRVFRRNPYVESIASPYRTDLVALTARLVGRPLGTLESIAVSATLIALGGTAVWRDARRTAPAGRAMAMICATLLVCVYHLPYDALVLTAPAVGLLVAPKPLGRLAQSPWRWAALALVAVPATSYFASAPGLALLAPDGGAWWVATSAVSMAVGLLYVLWWVLIVAEPEQAPRFPRRRLSPTGPVDWIARYDRFGPGWLMRRRLTWAAAALPERAERVLEVGFGSGVFQYELARRARLSVGIDIHPHAAQVERELSADGVDARLLQGDGERLPFGAGTFDAVVILSSLEFVADAEACLRECRRVLRRGGALVCVRPRQLRWIDFGFRVVMGSDPEAEFAGGRRRAQAAIETVLPDAARALRPRGWPEWLAPYEVLRFRRPIAGTADEPGAPFD